MADNSKYDQKSLSLLQGFDLYYEYDQKISEVRKQIRSRTQN